MKIKLERWKEVVRIEFKKDGYFYNNFVSDTGAIQNFITNYGSVIGDYKTIFIENNPCVILFPLKEIKTFYGIIDKHNKIKDDGYNHLCTGCKCRCKVITIPNPNHNTNCATANNWEPIPNKRIEIIEGEKRVKD